jgi:CheY-like chemotaxis protein
MFGHQAWQRIGAPRLRDVVIVVSSVVNGPEVERAVRDAGSAAYVRKPIDSETLAEILASCLAKDSDAML